MGYNHFLLQFPNGGVVINLPIDVEGASDHYDSVHTKKGSGCFSSSEITHLTNAITMRHTGLPLQCKEKSLWTNILRSSLY
ncbi:hypothetical protein RclHR1_06400013 [Rhizophagus clarus]|uniref:Uncharacterized protein n=1 Tax=Rhizophagus clarus TaxID=94130 RepID=A0A2Z6RXX3_9GLOM|nr:hypothetical protein RclHR1_06400013 [Rhizophagus clarus]